MIHLTDRQEAMVRTAAKSILKRILPHLSKSDTGMFVRGVIEDELFLYEWRRRVEEPIALGGYAYLIIIASVSAGFMGFFVAHVISPWI